MARSKIPALAVALGILLAASEQCQAQDDTIQAARGAISLSGANRNAFEFYACRYRITKANAKSYDDAMSGRWENAVAANYVLKVTRSKEFFSCDYASTPITVPKNAKPGAGGLVMQSVPFIGNSTLEFGERQVSYAPLLNVLNLFDESQSRISPSLTPWSMNMMGHGKKWLGPEVLMKRESEFEFKSGRIVQVGDSAQVEVRFADRIHGTDFRYVLNPAMGHLPSMVSAHSPERARIAGHDLFECRLLDATLCSKQRWFPKAWRAITSPELPGGEYGVFDLVVTELEVDKPPKDDEFSFTVPAGVMVVNPGKTGFKLRQEEKIAAEQMPQLFDLSDKAGSVKNMDTTLSHPRKWGRLRIFTLVAAALLVAWGAWMLIKSLQRKRNR